VIKMNGMKKYLIPILLTCLMAGQIATTYAEGVSHLEVSATNIYLTAGMRSNVSLQFYNTGSFEITEIEAVVTSSTPGLSVIANSQKVYNSIASQEALIYPITLFVDQGLALGSYTLSSQISYIRQGRTISLTVPITVIVTNPFQPFLKVTVSPSKLSAGDTTTIKMQVQDISEGSVSNVDVILTSGSPLLSIENQLNYHSDSINASTSVSFDVMVKALENTPIGAYSITAATYYSDNLGNRYKQSINLPVEVTAAALPLSSIITVTNLSTDAVSPGEQFQVTLRFACTGAAVYSGKASLSLDQKGLLTPVSPTNIAIGDLKPGQSTDQTYTLLLDGGAPAGEIPLAIIVKYIDYRGVQSTATETITVPVKQLVDFTLMEDVVVSAEIGKTTTFEGDILLVGTSRVEFTKVQIVEEGPVAIVTGSTEYMGAVDPDSPVPFSIKFAVKNGTAIGSYDLKLKVTYMDNRNLPQEKMLNVPLSAINALPNTPTTSNDGGIWGWIKRLFGIQ
jgi:hypothetical protein